LDEVFKTLLPLLHPFIPFVTVELWEAFGYSQEVGYIMKAAWPKPKDELRFPHEAMRDLQDAVRILSMHKAKGLEFPVVVVPFHHRTDPPRKPLSVDASSGIPLLTYRENSSAESVRGIAEQINLLYVAWTRPAEELYAFITQSGHSASRSSMGKALEALLEDLPFTRNEFACGNTPPPARPVPRPTPQAAVNHEVLSPEEAARPLMAWLPRLKIFRNPVGEKVFSERQRGLLAHACLESLRLTGDTASDVERAVDQGLRAFPIPMPDPEGARRDMAAMLAWYASLPETETWMRHGSPEQPLMDADGSIRRVDLLVDAPGEPLLAVEYKTGRPSPDHIAQVERYLAILSDAARRKAPEREMAGVIVYLDGRERIPVAGPEGRP
jgi:hypothetical protein